MGARKRSLKKEFLASVVETTENAKPDEQVMILPTDMAGTGRENRRLFDARGSASDIAFSFTFSAGWRTWRPRVPLLFL